MNNKISTNMKTEDTNQTENRPWGVFGTVAFSVLSLLFFYATQTLFSFLYVYIKTLGNPDVSLIKEVISLSSDNFSLLLTTLPASILTVALIIFIAYKRKNITVKEYLGLEFPTLKQLLFWIGIMVFYSLATMIVEKIIGRPIPESMVTDIKTANFLPLLLFSPIILAPIVEEFIFRGILFKGLLYTKLGAIGTVLITSILWASIHIQYEYFELFSIFLTGLIFGYARIKTKSLYTTIIMHMVMNILATIQLMIMIK